MLRTKGLRTLLKGYVLSSSVRNLLFLERNLRLSIMLTIFSTIFPSYSRICVRLTLRSDCTVTAKRVSEKSFQFPPSIVLLHLLVFKPSAVFLFEKPFYIAIVRFALN